LPQTLRRWLQFRVQALLPFLEGYLKPGSPEIARRVLGPYCRRCRACGTISSIARGRVGHEVTA
jgi:hypothetical protein